MEQIKTVEIKDICLGIYEGPHATPKNSDTGGIYLGIPALDPKGFIDYSRAKRIAEEDLPLWTKRVTPQEDDIVFTNEATLNLYAIIPANFHGCLGRRLGLIRPNKDLVNVKYLFYYFFSPEWRETVAKNKVSGATVDRILMTKFPSFPVALPSLKTQERIANILSVIDAKIEVNRQINDNLELQLKLLYKSWFIENQHPDSKESNLTEIIYFQEGPGIRNWQYVEKDGVKFINIRCIDGGDINLNNANMISKEEANGKYAHFMLKPFDIIMSCSGTLGRYAIVRKEHLPLCLNTSVIRFSPNRSNSDYSYIYGYLASEEFLNKQVEMACGSVQANFGPTHLKQIKLIAPPVDYCKSYHALAMPIINKILENRREIQQLQKLRDTLLPKLMSGELKINEIDC